MFRRLAFRIEKWIFKNCDGLIFISTYFKNIAENNYGEISKSVVCPNGVDLRRFSPELYDRDKIRGEFGVRGKIVCGYVGAFVHWHGIDWFVSEVALRLKDVPNLVLLLVGDGVCYESIRDVIKKYDIENQVIMTGRVMHRDVPRIMSAMDFGILPDSNEYGSPMKLLEFMAMGLGVVSPSYEPIKEVVNNNITGWLFEPGDRSAGIGKVMEIAMNADERKKVGLNACEFIRTSRQWSNNVELALSLLQDPSIC
jgi:glycosyltransferase involved in cell wall biosynthesis